MDYKDLGKKIRTERLKMNFTQERLAELVGISTAYMGQIECGERSLTLDKLVLIAKEINVTVDYLLSDDVPVKDDTMADLCQHI